jgi:hypothetical protein
MSIEMLDRDISTVHQKHVIALNYIDRVRHLDEAHKKIRHLAEAIGVGWSSPSQDGDCARN